MTAKLNNFIVLTCLAPNWVRIFAVFLFASSIAIAGEGLPLLRGGKSDYTIVISQGAMESEKYAAEEFQRFFAEASGQKLEISSNPGKKENLIFIGNSPELSQVMPELKLILLEAEESVVATKGSSLILAGGPGRGTLYAVYSFLDEFMGCRWYSSDFHHVPKRKELFIPALKVKRNPTFAYREVYIHSAIDPDWAARNRLNSALTPLQEKHGGQVRFGVFVHSFFTFVPPTKFFAEHPEWYSEIEGKRTADNAQLCLTNREMIKALTSAVRDKLLENKDVDIISVSQNDNSNFCQCAECQSAMEDEGSLSGVLVNVVNTVAKELEKEFPSVMFETLAYQKTRKAPIGARPRGNVIIRYCTIEACPVHPLETDDFNAGVMRDLKDWTNITPNVYLWHYVTNFSHYFMPHPNWRSLPQDIKTFSRLKVKGVFLQGAFNAPHADFPEMRSWIAARLLLNPELKSEDLQKEFIQAYYGNAAGPLRRYLDLLMDGALQDEKSHLTCYSQPKDYAFMTPEWTARATKYMEEARKSVSGNKAQLERVNRAALSVEYAMAMRSFEWRQAKNPVSVDPIGLTKAFLTKAKASGALRLNEAESMEMSEARMLGGR